MFGQTPGPRNPPPGRIHDLAASPHRIACYAFFEAPATQLQQLLPPGLSVGPRSGIAFDFSCLTDIDWLAGRGYSMLIVRIPVVYASGGSWRDAWFQPVVWENLTEPILSGREELGWNKIYADLSAAGTAPEKRFMSASWDAFQFFEFEMSVSAEVQAKGLPRGGVIHHKLTPSTGDWGRYDADYLTMTPDGGATITVESHFAGDARISFRRPSWEQMPTQAQIVNALADVNLGEQIAAGVLTTRGGKDLSDQIRLELAR